MSTSRTVRSISRRGRRYSLRPSDTFFFIVGLYLNSMINSNTPYKCGIIGGKYLIGPMIGKGSFGEVYIGSVGG